MSERILPKKNEFGYYEIRIEGIGGMGGNVGAKILAEAVVLEMGMNALAFAQYGSEKTGTPVKAFIRVSDLDAEIRIGTAVERPHLLAIFHTKLKETLPVLAGLYEDSTVVVNTRMSPDETRDYLELSSGTICCVDAMGISVEEKMPGRVNTPMLGAICKVSGFLEPDAIKAAIADAFGKKYPQSVEPNNRAFDRGYNEGVVKEFPNDGKYKPVPFAVPEPKLGWKNAPIGGVIEDFGNSIVKELSGGRSGHVPIFHPDLCINCAACEMSCPDFAFVWEEGMDKKGKPTMVLKGIDYQYCKGCLRCVEVCPKQALTTAVEADVNPDELTVHKEW